MLDFFHNGTSWTHSTATLVTEASFKLIVGTAWSDYDWIAFE